LKFHSTKSFLDKIWIGNHPGALDLPAILGIEMSAFVRHWFDRPALYAALDAQRRARGISWQQVARETGVAASTIVATKRVGLMETDGMLAMVRWLGCTPEKFIRGSESQSVTQTPSETAKFLAGHRFNAKTLYQALDAQRRSRKMTWLEVAQEIGGDISPPMLTRLAKGGRIGVHVMVSAVRWLGTTIEVFTRG
jgi:transcriptional regulator with XRE-family HTH domain